MHFAARAVSLAFLLVAAILPADRIAAQEPTKETLIATLNELYPKLESDQFDEALKHFALPEELVTDRTMVERELGRMIEIREISLAGIERLKRDGKFGTAVEVFGEERAGMFAKQMEADLKIAYGCVLESAEVMAIWKDGKFKLIRLDDVGKLEPVSNESAAPNPEEIFKAAMAHEKEGKFSKAWPLYAKARELEFDSSQLAAAFDRCMTQFSRVGIFQAGTPKDKLVQLLGKEHQTVELGKDRQRLIYGNWGVDFRSGKLHEVIDLKGAKKDLFQPSEFISIDLDGRDWTTQFREKRKGHVVAYAYPGKYSRDWTDQVTIERMLYLDKVSASDFATQQIGVEKKRYPSSQHKTLVEDATSLTYAAEVPLREDGTALHKLVRVMKGPTDIHRITYTLRSKERPTMEFQKKWLEIFQKATLTPVKK